MKQIYIIIFIAICIIGCKEKKEKQETNFSIQRLELANIIKNDTVSDFDLIDKFKYIKLETSDNCLVGEIRNVKFFDNRIIIADRNNKVLAFDTLGKFISQVGSKGNAGEEYTYVAGMFINEEEREIIIINYEKMLHYDLNGKFIKLQRINSKLSSSIVDIDIFKGSILKQTRSSPQIIYNSTIYSEEDLSKPMNFHPYRMNRAICPYPQSYNSISKTKEGLSFVKYLSDTIFQFNGDSIYPKYILVTGKPPIQQKIFDSFNTQNRRAFISEFCQPLVGKYSLGAHSIYETNDHILVSSAYWSAPTFVWNKHEKKGIHVNSSVRKKANASLHNTIKDVNDDYIICAYEYEVRSNILEGEKDAPIEPELRKLLEECADGDNPIIALYTFKKEFPWESYKR